VIARADPHAQGEQRLLAYFTAKRDTAGLASELRALVRSRLPDYMWPGAFVRMDRLPQAENGKIARRALPDPGYPRPELAVAYRAATSRTERTLRQLWLEVLRLDDAGVDDPFLDLGGDSLQAAQIVSRVRSRFGAEVSMAELLATGTIAGMARLLERPAMS
jgi:arthrofactin-type cyclic lipopeptide synthetase C